ncbi:MAG: radical SAM protein [Deltaproteobacteria bacterium]|jgi:hypothetical protein|nr:radical SAM protein [Deltaproteobacteria bacterium]
MLAYKHGKESDPFYDIYSSREWLTDYDPARAFPFFINLELTNRCQLDCFFCSRQLSSRPLGDLSLDMARGIFDEAAEYPGTGIRFTGWGEPLLHEEARVIALMAKERGLRLKVYTNGLKLTKELMKDFMDMGLDELQFSLQGLNREQYLFNRRLSNYERLEENIIMASKLRGKRKRPFLSVLTSVLENELEEASPEGFTRKWLEYVDKVAIDLTNLNFVKSAKRVKPYLASQSSGLTRGKCVDVFLALEVKWDGSIQFCGQDASNLPSHTIGRFGDISLRDAWKGDRMEAQRNLVGRSLGHESSEVCRNCYHNTRKYELFKAQASKEA